MTFVIITVVLPAHVGKDLGCRHMTLRLLVIPRMISEVCCMVLCRSLNAKLVQPRGLCKPQDSAPPSQYLAD